MARVLVIIIRILPFRASNKFSRAVCGSGFGALFGKF